MIDLGEIFAIDPNASYEAEEMAWLLFRTSYSSFKRHRRRRELEGFPKPISRWGKKMWSGAALLAWRDRQDQTTLTGAGNLVDLTPVLAARSATLHGRKRRA